MEFFAGHTEVARHELVASWGRHNVRDLLTWERDRVHEIVSANPLGEQDLVDMSWPSLVLLREFGAEAHVFGPLAYESRAGG